MQGLNSLRRYKIALIDGNISKMTSKRLLKIKINTSPSLNVFMAMLVIYFSALALFV